VAVGRARGAPEAALVERYLARMRPRPELVEIDGRRSRDADDEWRRIAARIPEGVRRVILDELGEDLTSTEFAARLGRWRDEGAHVVCVIGGAYGLTDQARASADLAFLEEQLAALKARDAAHAKDADGPDAEGGDARGDARRMALGLYAALAAWAREIAGA